MSIHNYQSLSISHVTTLRRTYSKVHFLPHHTPVLLRPAPHLSHPPLSPLVWPFYPTIFGLSLLYILHNIIALYPDDIL